MKKILFIMMILFLTTNVVNANEKTKMAKIDILFEKSNAKALLKRTYLQVNNMLNILGRSMKVKPSEKHIIKKFEKRLQILLDRKASWKIFKKPLRKLYADNFTEKEITDIISFYETKTGKKFLKVAPLVNIKSVNLSQKLLKDLLPEIKSISKQFQKELRAHRKK